MKTFLNVAFVFWLLGGIACAGTERYAVERDVTASVTKDLSIDYHPR